jgi:hypothetical protein
MGLFPCVADRQGLQHRARRTQTPRISLDRWQLDSREVEETSIGNYSGHAPTALNSRIDVVNPFADRKELVRSVAQRTSHSRMGTFRSY